ncbi:MAG: LytTR family transcriptional regulator [Saprospiraceae bacterium]|nr:LytTR family transcriptional regulator [Saprospiraceae bacterium]MCB0576087.1 LytTR family transcriptional regulator [Saprospiraceae bacterium]MCB9355503.1 LytTR family transcriptional regulator [Lewinellaceae bacterium]
MVNAIPLHSIPEPNESNRNVRAVAFKPEYSVSRKDSKKVVLPTMEGFCFEKVKHIAYLEASGNYTLLHFTDKRQILVCRTLREVESMLPEKTFTRIHRSHTIHLKHIKKYVRGKGGHVVLQNGVNLVVSAGQKETFMNALRQYFG